MLEKADVAQWRGCTLDRGLADSDLLLGFALDVLREVERSAGHRPQSCSHRDQRQKEESCEMMHAVLLSKCKINLPLKCIFAYAIGIFS